MSCYTGLMQRYAFLDRDGTLIREFGRDEAGVAFPPKNISEVQFMDGVFDGLHQLLDHNYKLVLATNQAYLGEARNPQPAYDAVMKYFYDQLSKRGIDFEYSMVCPHGLETDCTCRKPNIGGLKDFLAERAGKIDLKHSLMFGDRQSDHEFATNLGVRFVPVVTNGQFIVPKKLYNEEC